MGIVSGYAAFSDHTPNPVAFAPVKERGYARDATGEDGVISTLLFVEGQLVGSTEVVVEVAVSLIDDVI
jgi:hypothetical protein